MMKNIIIIKKKKIEISEVNVMKRKHYIQETTLIHFPTLATEGDKKSTCLDIF